MGCCYTVRKCEGGSEQTCWSSFTNLEFLFDESLLSSSHLKEPMTKQEHQSSRDNTRVYESLEGQLQVMLFFIQGKKRLGIFLLVALDIARIYLSLQSFFVVAQGCLHLVQAKQAHILSYR